MTIGLVRGAPVSFSQHELDSDKERVLNQMQGMEGTPSNDNLFYLQMT